MGTRRLARLLSGRVHYAWIVVGVMFTVILATVGVRAAPGVLIVPLEQAFGWNAANGKPSKPKASMSPFISFAPPATSARFAPPSTPNHSRTPSASASAPKTSPK